MNCNYLRGEGEEMTRSIYYHQDLSNEYCDLPKTLCHISIDLYFKKNWDCENPYEMKSE